MYVIAVQFAVYVLFPVLPFGIVTVVCAVVPLLPVHPVNVYPLLVGFVNVIVCVSTLYCVGFASDGVVAPPFNV